MSIVTFSVPQDNTTCSTFYNWAHRISAALASFGLVQAGDTGQVVWPVSIVNISAVAWNGSVATYTYTLSQGPGLVSGQTIIITGCTTNTGPGLNGVFVITGLPLSTTFTCANATAASSEVETANHAFGGVNTQVAITNALGNGSTSTYTYTNTYGTLRIGMSVVITGCTTAGYNGTFIVGSINTGAGTFTTVTGIAHATEVETGTGMITSNSCATTIATANTSTLTLPPVNGSSSIYEIWGFSDALNSTFPISIRIMYKTGSAATNCPGISFGICSVTDGAGNAVGVGVGWYDLFYSSASSVNGSSAPCYLSGSTNRLTMALFPSTSVHFGFISMERSHDSSGNDTSSYFTVDVIPGNAATTISPIQVSFNSTVVTGNEVHIPCITRSGAGTGSFGSSTIVSPVFPVVGAVGNPLVNLLVGKAVDWTDQTQFPFTLYNTSRNYMVCNCTFTNQAGNLVYDTVCVPCFMYRYD